MVKMNTRPCQTISLLCSYVLFIQLSSQDCMLYCADYMCLSTLSLSLEKHSQFSESFYLSRFIVMLFIHLFIYNVLVNYLLHIHPYMQICRYRSHTCGISELCQINFIYQINKVGRLLSTFVTLNTFSFTFLTKP